MISAFALLGCSVAWAWLLVRRCAPVLRTTESLAVAGALTLVTTCWLPFLVARLAGLSASLWLAPLLAAGLLGVEFALATRRPVRLRRLLRVTAAATWRRLRSPTGAGLLLLLVFHAWGHTLHCLWERDGGYWSAGAGWEDQSFHTALATSFALGDNLTRLSYPHLPEWSLGYPFLPDFQAGWLHAAGLSLPAAFVTGNLLASAVFLGGSACLLRRWLGSRGRALLALVLWHVGGGFGLAFLATEAAAQGSLGSAWWGHDYANAWELELHFHNLTTGILWPMRVVLYGLAVSGAVALLLRAALAGRRVRTAAFALAGGLAGALPLISAHGLIILACAIPPLALQHQPGRRARAWMTAVLVGAMLTLPQLAWMGAQLGRSDPPFVRWSPGWMTAFWGPTPWADLASHWAWNTGLWITLGAAALITAGPRFRRETAGWWLIFPLGYLVVFQPYVFDNLKLFAAGALAAAAGCSVWISRAWQAGYAGRGLALLLALACSASGLQSIVSEARRPAMIADAESRRFAEGVARVTPRDALIATAPHLHHPVLVLAGRRVVAANDSGLTLHGVPRMLERTGEVAKFYEGSAEVLARFRELQVGWVVVGPMERSAFPGLNQAFLEANSTAVLTEGAWQLRRLHGTNE